MLSVSAVLNAQNCTPASSVSTLDINNVSVAMLNGGDMWWDFSQSRYEVPQGSGKTAFFAHALWLAATDDDDNIYTAALRYRTSGNDYWAGPIVTDSNGINTVDCDEFNRHWSLTKAEIDAFIDGTVSTVPEPILNWPAKGNPNFSVSIEQDLAPFYDVNGDGLYSSDSGDYPLIKGDQAIFWVMNDIGNIHTASGGQQLGVEIHVMAYAYATNDVINNSIYYDYTILNKGEQPYHDFRIGFFTDSDMGNPLDDFIGCDSAKNLGYTYNGDPNDENAQGQLGYGTELPIVGVQMVNLPRNSQGEEFPMAHFGYFNNQSGPFGDPNTASDYLNYLSGKWRHGVRWTEGGNGYGGTAPANFIYPGNPSDTNTWTECSVGNNPGDRRMVTSFGPMRFDRGTSISFTEASIFSQKEEYEGGCVDIQPFLDETDIVRDHGVDEKCENFQAMIDATITDTEFSAQEGAVEINITGTQGILDYSWSNGATSKDIFNLPIGDYTVTVSNTFGCSEEATFTVDEIFGIGQIAPFKLNISPNPSNTGRFRVRTNESSEVNAKVYNVLGELVEDMVVINELDLSAHESGLYLVTFESEGQKATSRLIVTK
ncbi:MAG: hypothetical protein Salg2KO_16960 [Salibacteraceae bacterium]